MLMKYNIKGPVIVLRSGGGGGFETAAQQQIKSAFERFASS